LKAEEIQKISALFFRSVNVNSRFLRIKPVNFVSGLVYSIKLKMSLFDERPIEKIFDIPIVE